MDGPRTLGIEEELLLVDPVTRALSSRSPEVLKAHREQAGELRPAVTADELAPELFRHQLETRTEPTTLLQDARAQLVAGRRTAGRAARAQDLVAVASATAPIEGGDPRVSPDERYRDLLDSFGEVATTAGTCGMHVHVAIDSPEEGVGVIDRIAPWLPALLAAGANSPFSGGRDTAYASWRSQVWGRWPSAGPTEAFGDLAGYEEVRRGLQESGAARDDAMLYFDARLSVGQPTVEVRVLDVCTDPDDAVLLAALVRGLVETAAEHWAGGGSLPPWRAELLRAAQWRAARHGATGTLVHPVERSLRPARDVLAALVAQVRPRLEAAGDLDLVADGVERVLRAGGATRQRAALERTGTVEGVVDDLVARSERIWAP